MFLQGIFQRAPEGIAVSGYESVLEREQRAEAKAVKGMIIALYEHSGMPVADIYQGLFENMINPPSETVVNNILENKIRFVNKKPSLITYADRVKLFWTPGMLKADLRENQLKVLRRNYVLQAAYRGRVPPHMFTDDIRGTIAQIYITDESSM